MKKITILFLLVGFFTSNILSSPLLFKVNKKITTGGLELATFDASKYRQIRIGVKAISMDNSQTVKELPAYSQLIQKRAELLSELERMLKVFKEGHPQIVAKKNEINKINEEIESLEKSINEQLAPKVTILAAEDKDTIILEKFEEKDINRSIVIDSPPSKINIIFDGKGIYSVYIWGQ